MSSANSPWANILCREQIDAYHALTSIIDPGFAAADRAFYESRTAAQLRALASQAWNCNEPGGYQIARSYLALHAEAL